MISKRLKTTQLHQTHSSALAPLWKSIWIRSASLRLQKRSKSTASTSRPRLLDLSRHSAIHSLLTDNPRGKLTTKVPRWCALSLTLSIQALQRSKRLTRLHRPFLLRHLQYLRSQHHWVEHFACRNFGRAKIASKSRFLTIWTKTLLDKPLTSIRIFRLIVNQILLLRKSSLSSLLPSRPSMASESPRAASLSRSKATHLIGS